MLKARLDRRLLPDHRLRPIQKMPLSQRKTLLQKNDDNNSKPDGVNETARSTCCEPLFCIIDSGVYL
jgi:hypothetical protein